MSVLRLLRPINLVIIAVTMYAMRCFILVYETAFNAQVLGQNKEIRDFIWLVISTVFIAAAGNAINDYFDVKSDAVNRPDRQIVDKHVGRRKVIIIHWILNAAAFFMAILLSYWNRTFWYVFIHLVSINSLWLYSLYFQKKPFIGNFLIAGLTALVPILCGVHFYVQESLVWGSQTIVSHPQYWIQLLVKEGHFISLLAFFAFVHNFSREIIKDIEDVPGDSAMGMQTGPIVYGNRLSKKIAALFLLLPVLVIVTLFIISAGSAPGSRLNQVLFFIPVWLSLFCDICAMILLVRAQNRSEFIKADRWIKMAMFAGVLLPFYWWLWI